MFDVIWVAGGRDGELLGTFEDKWDAQLFAYDFQKEHELEFDIVCGGVAIIDTENPEELVEW